MNATTKEVWEAACAQLDEALEKQKRKSFKDLSALTGKEEGGAIEVKGVRMVLSSWAREEEDGSIGVIVEVRRVRFLGWSQVSVRGFFAFPDGNIKDMQDKDLWAHGY